MSRLFRPAVVVSLLMTATVAVGAITLYALESSEVVVLTTADSAGGVHEARVWVADDLGYSWIETAHGGKLFYQRLLENPAIEVTRDGRVARYHAVPVDTDEARGRLRALLAEKYGLADRWIGLFVDTSKSIPIRLEPR